MHQMLNEQRDQVDPEAECKEIRVTLRLMRENYERGLYEGEEYQYWQKVSTLNEKLALLERVPEPAINQAAQTFVRDLGEHHSRRAQGPDTRHDPGSRRRPGCQVHDVGESPPRL